LLLLVLPNERSFRGDRARPGEERVAGDRRLKGDPLRLAAGEAAEAGELSSGEQAALVGRLGRAFGVDHWGVVAPVLFRWVGDKVSALDIGRGKDRIVA